MAVLASQKQYTFPNIQGRINTLVNMYASCNASPEFDSVRYNHIDLDRPNTAHTDDDILSARIFPKHHFQHHVEPVSINTVVIKDAIVNMLMVFWNQSQSFLKRATRYVLLMDLYCERRLESAREYIWNVYVSLRKESVTQTNIRHTQSPVSREDAVHIGVSPSIDISPELFPNVEVISPVSCTWSVTDSITTQSLQREKTTVLRYALRLVFEELIHGGRLPDIDRM